MIEHLDSSTPFPIETILGELARFSSGLVLIDEGAPLKGDFSPYHVKKVSGGEGIKTFRFVEEILEEMVQLGLNRSSFLLCIGGGALLDAGGFAAALFMRGIPLFSVPTTLLAQVDAAYGGKTAINLSSGKNLAGAFHPAKKIWIYPPFVQTQDKRNFCAGFAEVIKYGVIADPSLFEFLEKKHKSLLQFNDLEFIIRRSLEIKQKFVESDPFDRGLREHLNFGHTIGHAIEGFSAKFLHGEAVAIGMCFEAGLAVRMGLFPKGERDRIVSLCEAFHLPTESLPIGELAPFLKRDKKNSGGKVNFILPKTLGQVDKFAYDMDFLLRDRYT